MRIDFTCKRGEGLKPLNKGRMCHQRAGWVKTHWMDNDTYCGKRGRLRTPKDGEMIETVEMTERLKAGARR